MINIVLCHNFCESLYKSFSIRLQNARNFRTAQYTDTRIMASATHARGRMFVSTAEGLPITKVILRPSVTWTLFMSVTIPSFSIGPTFCGCEEVS